MSIASQLTEAPDFHAWMSEREGIEAQLDLTSEATQPLERDRLLDRLAELERLILTTECFNLPAIRAKAHLVKWLMEVEQADGLPAMRHIASYLDGERSSDGCHGVGRS